MTPRVSVVIPVYNRWDYVTEAIRSALKQQYRPTEVLVVDDGSTEPSGEVSEELDPILKVVRLKHLGRSAARNHGIRAAQSSLVAFLDSDDAWLPDKLSRQVDLLAKNPDAGLVAGHVGVIDETGKDLPDRAAVARRIVEALDNDGCSPEAFLRHSGIFTSTVVVRRCVLQDVGYFDEDMAGNEDLDLWLRIARKWKVVVAPWPPLALYRVHRDNTQSFDMARGTLQLALRHLAQEPQLSRRAQALLLAHQARAYRTLGREKEARRSLAAALAKAPTTALSAGAPRLLGGSLLASLRHRAPGRAENG